MSACRRPLFGSLDHFHRQALRRPSNSSNAKNIHGNNSHFQFPRSLFFVFYFIIRLGRAAQNGRLSAFDCYTQRLLTMSRQAASFNNPTQIFAEDVTEEKGENARLSAFVGAIAVGDLVKSTLGPKGMDKIMQSAYVGSCQAWWGCDGDLN